MTDEITRAHTMDGWATRFGPHRWREPDHYNTLARERGEAHGPYAYPYRTCSYCGSIHPEDLIGFLEKGNARLDRADMKYGWPHKFYCAVPNPIAGQTVKIGSESKPNREGGRTRTPIMGTAPERTHAKFYSTHLQDMEPERFTVLAGLLRARGGIEFRIKDEGLFWKVVGPSYAPYPERATTVVAQPLAPDGPPGAADRTHAAGQPGGRNGTHQQEP